VGFKQNLSREKHLYEGVFEKSLTFGDCVNGITRSMSVEQGTNWEEGFGYDGLVSMTKELL